MAVETISIIVYKRCLAFEYSLSVLEVKTILFPVFIF